MSRFLGNLLSNNILAKKKVDPPNGESRVSEIGPPTQVKHNVHVGFNPETGKIEGLPLPWLDLLDRSHISAKDQSEHPKEVLEILEFYQDSMKKGTFPGMNTQGNAKHMYMPKSKQNEAVRHLLPHGYSDGSSSQDELTASSSQEDLLMSCEDVSPPSSSSDHKHDHHKKFNDAFEQLQSLTLTNEQKHPNDPYNELIKSPSSQSSESSSSGFSSSLSPSSNVANAVQKPPRTHQETHHYANFIPLVPRPANNAQNLERQAEKTAHEKTYHPANKSPTHHQHQYNHHAAHQNHQKVHNQHLNSNDVNENFNEGTQNNVAPHTAAEMPSTNLVNNKVPPVPQLRKKKPSNSGTKLSEEQVMDLIRSVVTPGDPRGKFKLLKKIGSGASGTVYTATLLETGEKVAIKMMDLTQQPKKELIVTEIMVMKENKYVIFDCALTRLYRIEQ